MSTPDHCRTPCPSTECLPSPFPQKPSSGVAERSLGTGVLAEALGGLGGAAAPFLPRLVPALLAAAHDAHPEVRSNAAFALGKMAEAAPSAALPYPHPPVGLEAGVGLGAKRARLGGRARGGTTFGGG